MNDRGRTRLYRRLPRSRRAVVGGLILLVVVLTALLAPWLAPYDPLDQDLLDRGHPASAEHPLGLDEVGRDNLSRVMHGARLSLQIGVVSVTLALAAGGLLGLAAGYRGGWLDSAITSALDVVQAVPSLLLAIVVVAILGRGLHNVIYGVAIAMVPVYARLTRVGVLAAKEQPYVEAARALGVRRGRLLVYHILPACLTPLLVQATLGVGTAILEAAGLSFLGLGVQPPAPEWGAMLGQGRGAVLSAPHIVLYPGLAIAITVLGFNLLGEGVQEALDVHRWTTTQTPK
ncbi:MAG TPA: ABC transporter permease [Anaerolineae bacterium]|nr:ABC transporter permease [Anaerolineae bacterium]